MGRLAMLMNKYESIGRKRKRPSISAGEDPSAPVLSTVVMENESSSRTRDEEQHDEHINSCINSSNGSIKHKGVQRLDQKGKDGGEGNPRKQRQGTASEKTSSERSTDREGSKSSMEDVEISVAKTGSAMREVAVASAPKDAAAAEISSMLKVRKRKKEKEVQEAFSGEYVPMDPLNWRARGR